MPSRKLSSRQQLLSALSVLILAISFLRLVEIPLISACLLTVISIIFIRTGRILSALAGFTSSGLGIELIVGVSVYILSTQTLLIVGVPPNLAHWSIFVFFAGSAFVVKHKTRAHHELSTNESWTRAFTALSVAVLIFGMWHPWSLAFGLPVICIERSWQFVNQKPVVIAGLIGIVSIGWWGSTALRPERWWYFYQGNDSQYFEALGWTGAHWGLLEHPGFLGGTIAPYHWLSYVLVGSLSHLGLLPPWDVFMKFGVALIFFLMAAIYLGFARHSSKIGRSGPWTVSTIAVAANSGMIFNSLSFSIPVGMSVLVLADQYHSATPWRRAILFCLLSTSLIFSKTSTALVVLGFMAITTAVRSGGIRIQKWNPVSILAGMGIALYLLLFRNASQLSSLNPGFSGQQEALRDIWLYASSPRIFVQSSLWLLGVVLVRKMFGRSNQRLQLLLLILFAGSILGVTVAKTDPLMGFITPIAAFISLYASRAWGRIFDSAPLHKQTQHGIELFATLGFGYLIGAVADRVFNLLETLFITEAWRTNLIWENTVALTLFSLPLVAAIVLWQSRRLPNFDVLVGILVLTLGSFLGGNLASYRVVQALGPDPLTNWRGGNSGVFSDTDLGIVGKWVRENTDSDVILASNNFCCSGQQWWSRIVENIDSYDPDGNSSHPDLEPSYGGDNYLAPAETRRRFLMQGLGHQAIPLGGTATSEQIRRMNISLDFANQPTSDTVEVLKSYGVSGFLVNLALTTHRDWSDFAIEKFRNGNFVYLELK